MNVVAAIIEDTKGQILLSQRPQGKDLAGYWEFPGGKMDPGEDAETALMRELKEELQLDVSIRSRLGQFEYRYGWGMVYLHVFVVRAKNEPRATTAVAAFKWFDEDGVNGVRLAPADLRPWFFYLDQSRQSRP